jgi:hypothetical protein
MSRRSRIGVTLACIAVLVAAGCASDAPRTQPNPRPQPVAAHAPREELDDGTRPAPIVVTPYERQAFLELAMEPAVTTTHRGAVLQRWSREPTLTVTGAPTSEDLRQLATAAQRWSAITGRRLTLTGGSATVSVHFVPRSDFAGVLGVDHVDPTAVGLTRVSFAPGHRGDIVGGIVVVASDDDQVTRNRTIAHELGHVMGLQHSTCPSSLMDGSSNGERSVRWSPSALDVRMGALLYDPRLTPGLDRAAVETALTPSATDGATCGPVDLELIRAAGTGRHYFCVRSAARVRPCTSNVAAEPTLPIVNPDAWTDGATLRPGPRG